MDLRQQFLKVYSTLPLGVRKEVIVVLDPIGPVSWEAAFFEVEQDTEQSKEILEKLSRLAII